MGYDIGSRIAQAMARDAPDRVRALVIAPPLPGVGERMLGEGPMREFWYQPFHRLPLSEELLDGNRDAIRTYLRHFWSHWSGPGFEPSDELMDRLADAYSPPGAFTASIEWYRVGSGTVAVALAERPPEHRITQPTRVLWPEHDPLFPREWGDRVGEFFADVTDHRPAGSGALLPARGAGGLRRRDPGGGGITSARRRPRGYEDAHGHRDAAEDGPRRARHLHRLSQVAGTEPE